MELDAALAPALLDAEHGRADALDFGLLHQIGELSQVERAIGGKEQTLDDGLEARRPGVGRAGIGRDLEIVIGGQRRDLARHPPEVEARLEGVLGLELAERHVIARARGFFLVELFEGARLEPHVAGELVALELVGSLVRSADRRLPRGDGRKRQLIGKACGLLDLQLVLCRQLLGPGPRRQRDAVRGLVVANLLTFARRARLLVGAALPLLAHPWYSSPFLAISSAWLRRSAAARVT